MISRVSLAALFTTSRLITQLTFGFQIASDNNNHHYHNHYHYSSCGHPADHGSPRSDCPSSSRGHCGSGSDDSGSGGPHGAQL